VRDAAAQDYPVRREADPFKLLIVGGSQGARVFSEVLPAAIAELDPADRTVFDITQQCRPEDIEEVRGQFAALGMTANLLSFIADLPKVMAESHLVIGRAGASTVAELAVIGRPSILVPLPHSLDQDQLKNAQSLAAANGAFVMEQSTFSPQALAQQLIALSGQPEKLEEMAGAAKQFGTPDAVEKLADLTEQAGQRNN
jgi:UDP-N-acetylglucosamine--N-acetylmuramyl-(pentapeptide) pyrophosphoryl-undecaprenol N-acetylglucosamine transferase